MALSTHFEDLRRRFPVESQKWITNTQHSFETMEFISRFERPESARCAFFVMSGINFLVWEMDEAGDEYRIFATPYAIPIGSIKLSSQPSGIIIIAGFHIHLGDLANSITELFKPQHQPSAPVVTGDKKKKLKILLFGVINSFGHHFWNEVSGLTSAIDCGLLDTVDGVIVGPYDYFHLAPYLREKGKQIWKLDARGSMVAPSKFVLYASNVVTEEARRLVLDNAAKQAPVVFQHVGKRSLCFQIRRQRRFWVNEENGIAELIKLCATEWPGMVFYIDGHGTSKGASNFLQDNIMEEENFFARVKGKLGDAIDVRSMIGMDINCKINIMRNIDLFVGAMGSGAVLPAWVVRRPDIIYGPTSFYSMIKYQEDTVPELGSVSHFLPQEHIIDLPETDQCFDVGVQPIMGMIRREMAKMSTS